MVPKTAPFARLWCSCLHPQGDYCAYYSTCLMLAAAIGWTLPQHPTRCGCAQLMDAQCAFWCDCTVSSALGRPVRSMVERVGLPRRNRAERVQGWLACAGSNVGSGRCARNVVSLGRDRSRDCDSTPSPRLHAAQAQTATVSIPRGAQAPCQAGMRRVRRFSAPPVGAAQVSALGGWSQQVHSRPALRGQKKSGEKQSARHRCVIAGTKSRRGAASGGDGVGGLSGPWPALASDCPQSLFPLNTNAFRAVVVGHIPCGSHYRSLSGVPRAR